MGLELLHDRIEGASKPVIEAVSRNVAALEFVEGRFRQDGRLTTGSRESFGLPLPPCLKMPQGRILSMWLSIALQKANQKLETRQRLRRMRASCYLLLWVPCGMSEELSRGE